MELSVVLFRDGDFWIAQGLEHDITAQGRTLQEVKLAFMRTVAVRAFVDQEAGVEPFSQCEPAPTEFWELHKTGEQLASHIRESARELPPLGVPIPSLTGDCRIHG